VDAPKNLGADKHGIDETLKGKVGNQPKDPKVVDEVLMDGFGATADKP
jgi:hypothetical protein